MTSAVLCFEVLGKEDAKLRSFYSRPFGWKINVPDPEQYDSGLLTTANGGICGGIGASPDSGAGFATFHVELDDPTAYIAKAEKLGGKTLIALPEIPAMGLKFAYIADPEGHVVGPFSAVLQTNQS